MGTGPGTSASAGSGSGGGGGGGGGSGGRTGGGAVSARRAPTRSATGALAPQRDGTGRRAAPRRPRPTPAAPFAAALVAADCAAVLPAALVLTPAQRSAALLLQLTVCVAALHAYAGLYRPAALGAVRPSVLDELPALAGRLAVAWCAAAALLAAQAPGRALGAGTLAGAYGTHLAALAVFRGLVHHRGRRAARGRPRSALVVGPAQAAQRLAALLQQHPEYGVRPVGIACAAPQDIPQPAGAAHEARAARATPGAVPPPLPLLTSVEDVRRAVIQNSVRDALFVAGDEGGGSWPEVAAPLRRQGVATWLVAAPVPGQAHPAVPMGGHLWGHEVRPAEPPGGARLSKRVLDIAAAAVLLLVAAPVLLLCATAVRLADGPGVLFRQERVGQDGRLFTLLKFRTLRPEDEHEAETRWSVAHDDRLGAVGSFLRRTSLDELPQLWNVLRGDMSLVGPRPERPYFVERFSQIHPGYAARHRMPVGLTGLAQVHGLRGDTSIEDRCRFDNHYIDHWSLWQDVCILLRTAATLIRPAGS
ncbi:exopolysaccharide biosynthesis polyprenyl glycosylphosphotransferase [Streptomyces sp. TRM64462]|uniref:exopolysaccharide biosynthesis polyprenyl glycosylphosphotransferase n=1 Tax=Streptomyces sp. TRM64462 TaxID=2741726 RepID=UPI001586EFD1